MTQVTLPNRLQLEDVLRPDEVKRIGEVGTLVFHVAGDTGGVKSPEPQRIVACTWLVRSPSPIHPRSSTTRPNTVKGG